MIFGTRDKVGLAVVAVAMIAMLLTGAALIGAGERGREQGCRDAGGRVVDTSNSGSWICVDSEGGILGGRTDY